MLGSTSAAVVLSFAGLTFGQSGGTLTTRPAAAFASYQQLRQHFSERQALLSRQLLRERLAALESFFAGAKGEDLEGAYRDFVSVAIELEQYGRAAAVAERYAKEFGASAGAASVAGMRITALAEQGKADTALSEWARLAENSRSDDWGAVCDAGIRLGDTLVLAGRTADARKQYDEVNRRMSRYPNVAMFLARRTSALTWVGQEAPALEGTDLAGKSARLNEYRGRVVLLDFWATSCVPCLRELPGVIKTYNDHHTEGFEVVGISLDPDVEALTAFLGQNKVPWRQLCDGQSWRGPNATKYAVKAVPTMFLIGRDGKIAFMPLSADDLDYALTRLLRKSPTTASAGR